MSRLQKSPSPQHVAIIMDGNGRWAQERGLPRIKGHEAGADSVLAIIKACRDHGVKYLTLYAFSVENWVRPATEVQGLMRLLKQFLAKKEAELHEHQVRLRVMGRIEDLPLPVRRGLKRVEERTSHYENGQLILALSYGGRTEIAYATKQIARKVAAGEIELDSIDEQTVAGHLYLPDVPDPDLIIRTSGEMRLSNFLLWQASYAELYVTPVMWPDFREAAFAEALVAFGNRGRRFGGVRNVAEPNAAKSDRKRAHAEAKTD